MKSSKFYSIYADLPLKKRKLNCGLNWNQVFSLLEEKKLKVKMVVGEENEWK